MRRWLTVGAIGMLAALPAEAAGAGGGGGGGGGGGDSHGGGAATCPSYAAWPSIELRDNCFAGVAHFTNTGSLVVRNRGRVVHDLTAVDGSFATGPIGPGQEATLTFVEPGVFRMYCTLHGTVAGGGMAGVVVVGEPDPRGTVLASSSSEPPPADGVRFSSFTLGAGSAALCAGIVGAIRRRRRHRQVES